MRDRAVNPRPVLHPDRVTGEAADAQAVLQDAHVLLVDGGQRRLADEVARHFLVAAEVGERYRVAAAQVAGAGG